MTNISDVYSALSGLSAVNFILTTLVGLLVIVYHEPNFRKDKSDERPHV